MIITIMEIAMKTITNMEIIMQISMKIIMEAIIIETLLHTTDLALENTETTATLGGTQQD